jgi:hypothetical protein
MLSLKSDLSSFTQFSNSSIPRISFTSLPPEVLSIVLVHLNDITKHSQNRLPQLVTVSTVNHACRQAALPLLFERTSCVVREHPEDQPLSAFVHLSKRPHLLKHVKVLGIREALHGRQNRQDATRGDRTMDGENHTDILSDRAHDLQVLQVALSAMKGLQYLRYVTCFVVLQVAIYSNPSIKVASADRSHNVAGASRICLRSLA